VAATGSGSVLGVGTDIYALIDFLIKKTDAKVLNQQTLWTKDNEQANFFKGSQVAFLGSESITQQTTSQNIEFDRVGMELRARPSITPENNVDMVVNVMISQLTSDLVNDQPVRAVMETTTNMIVQDGQTLLLGGILFQNDTRVEHKLPLLGDAPLIGGLFRHSEVNLSNSEMFVFMTPRVFEEPNATVAEAQKSQEKLDAIRRGLDHSLEGLKPSAEKKSDGTVDSEVEDILKQDGEPSAQLHNEGQKEKPQVLHDRSNVEQLSAEDSKKPKVHNFGFSRSQISPGQNSALSWTVTNSDRIRIEPDVGKVGILGSKIVYPTETTEYTIIAANESGETRLTQKIEVVQDDQRVVARKSKK
jgi:hypothetical protein